MIQHKSVQDRFDFPIKQKKNVKYSQLIYS